MTRAAACALAIGGVDPGGGAGLAADLRAFAAAGAFGCLAVSLTTVQSTRGLRDVRVMSAGALEAQAMEVLAYQHVRAIKIGALGSASNVRAVARILASAAGVPCVIDTPIVPTRGAKRLLSRRAAEALRTELFPRTTLLTVNASEAQTFVGHPVQTEGDATRAALALAAEGPRAVLVKGGHLRGAHAVDTLALDGCVYRLRAPRLRVGSVHGAGCVLASLVAGRLAVRRGDPLEASSLVSAVRWAKRVHHEALSRPWSVGGELVVLVPTICPNRPHAIGPNAR